MSAERPQGQDEDWLRGLSGARPSEPNSVAFEEGRRLRAGLDRVPEVDAARADWADVMRRAGHGSETQLRVEKTAENTASWRRVGALSAVLVLALGWVWQAPFDAEPQWRGEGANETEAHWLSPSPAADAAALASELKRWGAEVSQASGPSGQILLSIRCQVPCDARVAARLAELETALAPDGRLRLRVLTR